MSEPEIAKWAAEAKPILDETKGMTTKEIKKWAKANPEKASKVVELWIKSFKYAFFTPLKEPTIVPKTTGEKQA